jgi:hypothetical protein
VPRKPNVVIFLTDQQRHDTTGLHGNPVGLTPNFDRFAAAGTHIPRLPTPVRSGTPGFADDKWSTETGGWRNEIPLPEDAETAKGFCPRRIRNALHRQVASCGARTGAPALRGGWQDWLAANNLEFDSDAYDCNLYDGEGAPQKLPGYRVVAMSEAASRYIVTHQDEPLILFISFLEPHDQNHTDDYLPPAAGRPWTPNCGPRLIWWRLPAVHLGTWRVTTE